jgi:hypothetical protein
MGEAALSYTLVSAHALTFPGTGETCDMNKRLTQPLSDPAVWWLTTLLILAAGFALRGFDLMSLHIFIDEPLHIGRAQEISTGVNLFAGLDQNKWFYEFFLALFRPNQATGYWIGRWVSALWGLVSVASCIALGRVIGGRRVGLLAGMIYAVLPLATFHERQALVDPMMTAATTFSMVVTFHLLRRPRWWHGALLTLAFVVARLTKPAMLPFLILPLVAFALFIPPQRRSSNLLKALGMWAAAVAITLGAAELVYFLAARAGVFPRETLQVSLANTVLEKLHDPGVIEGVMGDLGVLAEIHVLYVGWLVLALAALACLWAILAPRKRWRETLYLLIPGLLFAAMPLLATRPTRTGEIASRYLLLDASALVTLAALGLSLTLERLPRQVARWALPVLVGALLVFPLQFNLTLIRDPLDLHFTRYDRRVYVDEYWINNYQGLANEINADSTDPIILVYPPNYDFPIKKLVSFPVVALNEPWPLTPEKADHLITDLNLSQNQYVDLVLYDPFFGDPRRLVSRELQQVAYPIGPEEWHGMLYFQPYITGSDDLEMQPMKGEFEGVIALEAGMVEPQAAPGGVVRMAFQWRSPVPIEDSFKVFTHIVSPDGELVAQLDDIPGDGLYPTDTWEPGQPIVDRYAIRLPEDIPPGRYEVRVGLYDEASGLRLRVTAGEGDPLEGYVIGGYVEVTE